MPCTHLPRPSLAPQPSMHRWREQSAPPKPAKHVHTPPAEHAPCPSQSLGHAPSSHASPDHPGSHAHLPWSGLGLGLGLGFG